MNSVILHILITFESCIYAKYLLVEITVGQITDMDSKESQRNQFFRHANKKHSSKTTIFKRVQTGRNFTNIKRLIW